MANKKYIHSAKCDPIAILAHQLRGPLGGIRIAADSLLREDQGRLSKDVKESVKFIKNNSERLLSLAETSINAARIEAGIFNVINEPVDAEAEIRMVLAEVEPFAKIKKVKIIVSFSDLPPRLNLDRELLRNIVFNLADNAIKYTDKGSIKVECKMKGKNLVILVADTGAGLTAAEMKRIFHRFETGGAKKNKSRGTGLGLYVVKRLSEAAGGSVKVTSKGLGKGSVFTVELPVCGD